MSSRTKTIAEGNHPDTAGLGTTNDAETIEQDIERLRGDIAALAQSITRYGAGKTGEVKMRASKAGRDLAKTSQETLDSMSEELAGLEEAVSTRVRERPLQALGIAAGVGFLIAAVWSSRR
ncbi:DUF883 family protein [Roseibium aggregatum]|uniref:DUF883 family protein n=1 Tax=Roseibium aggregatum TaxID=187304 RepID=A0A926P3M5_9HYPH|nr:DUF883 family protein [Roseibium aggregatum]MBD1549555.1 DUF883 family protein [Roseibium aggregatum]